MTSYEKIWGLYHKNAKRTIPLKSLHASVSIVNTISRVKYTQNYYNDSDKFIETEFFFPISSDACFDSFEAKFNDTTIRGLIKRKQEAQEEYKEAIAQGKTAAYSEINEETDDIMKIMIGNIPPETTIAITYSYIQKLEVVANKFLCFRLFSTITPRYNGNFQDVLKADISLLSNYPAVSSHDPEAYPWVIEAEIQSPSPITFVKSPSHDVVPVFGNEGHTCNVTFKSNTPQYPNQDFILLYTNESKQDKIDYLLTPFEEGYCAMVNVRADFQTTPNEKVYENLVKAKEVENEYSLDEVRGEYIFLIDRSGSMDGERIRIARDSLVLFLKSLPPDSLFNVVSFGSSYEFLRDGPSQKYTQSTLERAVDEVERFSADFGGTEIYKPLKIIFNSPLREGYPRSVFLLTDGAVSNTSQVLKLIQDNRHKNKMFTIGIGDGCSQELITQAAACGHGKHAFVAKNSEIYEKVISLLNTSLSPCYSDISFKGNNFDAVVKALTPNPSTISSVIDGQTTTFFLLLRSEAFANDQRMALKLNMKDSRSQQRHSIDICLDINEAIQNEFIPKLAVHDMIRRLETEKTNIVWMSKEDIQETLVDLSLKYGVLCKETAFFCETEKANVKAIQQNQKIKLSNDSQSAVHRSQLEVLNAVIQMRTRAILKRDANDSDEDEDFETVTRTPKQQQQAVINSAQMTKAPPNGVTVDALQAAIQKRDAVTKKLDADDSEKKEQEGIRSPIQQQKEVINSVQMTKALPNGVTVDALQAAIQKRLAVNKQWDADDSHKKEQESIRSPIQQQQAVINSAQKTEALPNRIDALKSQTQGRFIALKKRGADDSDKSESEEEDIRLVIQQQKQQNKRDAEDEDEYADDFEKGETKEEGTALQSGHASNYLPNSSLNKLSPTVNSGSYLDAIKKLKLGSVNSGSYLDVIKKQKFEGFWDPQDSSIHQSILKNGVLPEIPEQIKTLNSPLAQTIWVTILVLLWLEVSCQSERKAWLLIYQKGINWLKKNGVNYEENKSLGASEIKV